MRSAGTTLDVIRRRVAVADASGTLFAYRFTTKKLDTSSTQQTGRNSLYSIKIAFCGNKNTIKSDKRH